MLGLFVGKMSSSCHGQIIRAETRSFFLAIGFRYDSLTVC